MKTKIDNLLLSITQKLEVEKEKLDKSNDANLISFLDGKISAFSESIHLIEVLKIELNLKS